MLAQTRGPLQILQSDTRAYARRKRLCNWPSARDRAQSDCCLADKTLVRPMKSPGLGAEGINAALVLEQSDDYGEGERIEAQRQQRQFIEQRCQG